MADETTEYTINLIGKLFSDIENILSPRPKNVWHVPGALQRVLQSVSLILQHGTNNGNELWNFICGVRVLRPDLWPVLKLKQLQNKSTHENTITQWLTISLHSCQLKEQIRTLLEDRDRLHKFYHEEAFLRNQKYTSALLIVLEAIENNSQDILATIDPSLMVKYYSQYKKLSPDIKPMIPQDLTNKQITNEKKNLNTANNPSLSSDSDSDSRDLNISGYHKECKIPSASASLKSCLSVEDDDADGNFKSQYKVSPNCLEVNYNLQILSEGESNGKQVAKKPSLKNESFDTFESKPVNDIGMLIKKGKPRKRVNRNIADMKDYIKKSTSFGSRPQTRENYSFSSTSTSNSDNKHINIRSSDISINSTNIVAPSKFLVDYLASKNKLQQKTPIKPLNFIVPQLKTESNTGTLTIIPKNIVCESETKSQEAIPLVQTESTFNSKENHVQKHVRSHSDGSKMIVSSAPLFPITSTKKLYGTSSSQRSLIADNIEKPLVRKRFMDDGGHSITSDADGFFPHPQPGQNLMDFLSSPQFSKTSAQLDKENAHFIIAEAVLAAIEQMNFDNIGCEKKTNILDKKETNKYSNCNLPDESEEDSTQNWRTLPVKRRTRVRNRAAFVVNTSDDEPVTTDYSILDSAQSSDDFSDSVCYTDVTNEQQTEATLSGSLDNLSLHSNDPSSAENVAISLLMHYNTNLLPQANELHWLVTEQDAPQKLLPLPNSFAVSPDDADHSYFTTLLRGTSDWAPPRPQLILTLHSNTKRSARLIDQKWKCAGCGLKVLEKLSRHFRLCHYLGRYFCTNCHSNKKAIIPAMVLHKWDFKKCYVSNFSSELLSRMSSDPLFHLGSLNSKLYKRSRDLHQTHIYRLQLYHTKIYINVCSRATKEKSLLDGVPQHWSTDPHLYSLDDLIAVKQGHMVKNIHQLTTTCISHISSCKVCLGHGFICEICGHGHPIFPFQLDAVTQCSKCHECFHFSCFSTVNSCPRCARREKRD